MNGVTLFGYYKRTASYRQPTEGSVCHHRVGAARLAECYALLKVILSMSFTKDDAIYDNRYHVINDYTLQKEIPSRSSTIDPRDAGASIRRKAATCFVSATSSGQVLHLQDVKRDQINERQHFFT
ncbi:hypothetical protein RRG08_051387 [Elysia crispata]|uniref:Uncharacterized protein n=1 Tax=Elysia crispata TaxID=231223 RepID=A0AAE1E9R1_9GAST|nr:hypothetical protein RRG08_051387 [Elysia crispata]